MNARKELIVICIACAIVRLPWIFMVPMVEAPDEFAHYWVIKFIAENLRLPSAQEVIAGGPSAVYGSMPHLGYIPHIVAAKLLPFWDISLADRFGSLFAGIVVVAVAWRIGRELFPNSKKLAIALPLTLLFHPQFVLVNSYANNDSTTAALTSGILLILIIFLKRGVTLNYSLLVGFLAGWVALSKYSGYAIFPVIGFAMFGSFFIHVTPVMSGLACLGSALSLALAACLWWFVRNHHEFAGDWLGTVTMRNTWAATYHRDLNYHESIWQVLRSFNWWQLSFNSFWAMFGYMTRSVWQPVYLLYLLFTIATIGGVIRRCVHRVKEGLPRTREEWIEPSCWIMMVLCLVINFGAMVWASTANLGGPQGRYLFSSEIPIAALILAGLSAVTGKMGEKLAIAFVVYNALVTIGSFIWLAPIYGFHLKTF